MNDIVYVRIRVYVIAAKCFHLSVTVIVVRGTQFTDATGPDLKKY